MNDQDVNRLIYEKSNRYRLHADVVRWALLGGYAAAFAAMLQVQSNTNINYLFFAISVVFVFVLAVQNWFYNLFAGFVRECECRLVEGTNLRPLEAFAKSEGENNTPYHPSFIFALVTVLLTSTVFMYRASGNMFCSVLNGLLLLTTFFALFANWDRWVYKPFLKRLSNLFLDEKSKSKSISPQ